MHFIIFGAGEAGIHAWEFLQNDRVKCFADNYKAGQVMHTMMGVVPVDKLVIDFPAMLDIYNKGETVVIVASRNYSKEIVDQLKKNNVHRYFVFRESDAWRIWSQFPCYRLFQRSEGVTYTKRLADHRVSRFSHIAILGCNEFLPYLISAMAFQTGFERILGVIDTPDAQNANLMGLTLISWDEARTKADCLVVNAQRSQMYHCDEIEEKEHDFYLLKLYDVEQEMSIYDHPELRKYKNIHKGKRCFAIGNGPSLTVDDLETLHRNNEICFGVNKVYRIYPKTKWRADYISVTDTRTIEDMRTDFSDDIPGVKFIADGNHRENETLLSGFQPIHFIYEEFYPLNTPRFSDDITKCVYMGHSVVYDMSLQIAAYMGFDEIYLLGVDMSYSGKYGDNNHFIKDYARPEELERYSGANGDFDVPKTIKAFEKAEQYSRQHGFRIFNATRGGNLEAFERVNFEDLF